MRKLLTLAVGLLVAGTLAACEQQPTSPDASVSSRGADRTVHQTADLFAVDLDPGDDITYPSVSVGTAHLVRRPDSGGLSWRLRTDAFDPGHAYTVWVGNTDGFVASGGWGGGGLVGGNGQFTASGNDCVWPLVTFSDGGFEPGGQSDCESIDESESVTVFALDHRDWEPGDVMELWEPNGGPDGSGTTTQLAGFVVATFPATE